MGDRGLGEVRSHWFLVQYSQPLNMGVENFQQKLPAVPLRRR